MSEATPEPSAPATPADPAPEPTPAAPAQEPDWKAEARKWEERSKGNKSALDELTEKFKALEATNTDLAGKVKNFETEKERAALVADVASKKGVPASALRGSTREELEAHADELAELIKPSAPVIPNQERTPENVPDSPNREFARKLFGNN
jgi:hypothetical protein